MQDLSKRCNLSLERKRQNSSLVCCCHLLRSVSPRRLRGRTPSRVVAPAELSFLVPHNKDETRPILHVQQRSHVPNRPNACTVRSVKTYLQANRAIISRVNWCPKLTHTVKGFKFSGCPKSTKTSVVLRARRRPIDACSGTRRRTGYGTMVNRGFEVQLLVNFKAVVTGTKVSERRRSLFMRAPQNQSTTQLQQEVLQRFQQEPPRCTQQLSLHNKLHANTIGASAWNVTVAALNRERERSVESKKNIESNNARLNSASHVNTKNTLRKRPPWTVASYRK